MRRRCDGRGAFRHRRSGAKFARVGIEDRFGQSGTPAELFADYGLTAENIAENARRLVK